MDKKEALRISKTYLKRLKSSKIEFSEAWLFGSYATGNYHEDSDVDLAIVLSDKVSHTFDTDVQLMIIRKGEETIIEPHAIAKDDFNNSLPIYKQIVEKGIRIA